MSGIKAFIGKWREESKEGFDEMAGALGLPQEKKDFFRQARTEISYNLEGDEWVIVVGVQGFPNNRTFRFKLGEQYDSASIDGSPMKSVMQANGDKFIEKHLDEGLQGAAMDIVRWIEGDKMIVETECAGHKMRSVYCRI